MGQLPLAQSLQVAVSASMQAQQQMNIHNQSGESTALQDDTCVTTHTGRLQRPSNCVEWWQLHSSSNYLMLTNLPCFPEADQA